MDPTTTTAGRHLPSSPSWSPSAMLDTHIFVLWLGDQGLEPPGKIISDPNLSTSETTSEGDADMF